MFLFLVRIVISFFYRSTPSVKIDMSGFLLSGRCISTLVYLLFLDDGYRLLRLLKVV